MEEEEYTKAQSAPCRIVGCAFLVFNTDCATLQIDALPIKSPHATHKSSYPQRRPHSKLGVSGDAHLHRAAARL
eukprot:1469956-Pleurochrysis_carterae.AAC.1